MAQKALPYEYEIEESKTGMTCLGGLPTYLDLAASVGLLRSIGRHLTPIFTGFLSVIFLMASR